MESAGIRPNLVVLTSVMEACTECGRYQEALGIMTKMRELGITPDNALINSAIKACCLNGAVDEAEQLAQ